MAARRCSTCSVNYGLGVKNCPRCGNETWHSVSNEPDSITDKRATVEAGAADGAEYALGMVDVRLYAPKADAKIIDWRASCFRRMGFGDLICHALALRRDVDREDVKLMLERGATHAQVRDIIL